jgi:dTDP-4-amino-4,6-dideoxygalactose transaminase
MLPFIDLQAQRRRLGEPLNQAILAAVANGAWINGPQVKEFEKALADYCGVKHAVACANGTDALLLVLMAWGIGPGDAVFVPTFTFAATGEIVALAGATPVFVDILPDTYNMDPTSLEAAVAKIKQDGKLKPKAVIPVDLFGQPADYDQIEPIARREGLKLLCDTAQGFGGVYKGKTTGSIGDAAATSFFPAKPLGCYGDGGATFTDDDDTAAILRSLCNHGAGSDRYDNIRIGMNSRLDTIQAAILLEKIKIFKDEVAVRGRVAARYNELLGKSHRIVVPRLIDGVTSTWAQYTIQVPDRPKLMDDLKAAGIPTAIYYPIPMSKQQAYAKFPAVPTPNAEKIGRHVVSLPFHPYLDETTQDKIIEAVLASVGG